MSKQKLMKGLKKNLLSGLLSFCAVMCGTNIYAQFPYAAAQDSIRKLNEADYKQMLAQLNISSTRPGPSGNPAAPNAANIDESKAVNYTSIPDPLVMKNGKKVTSAKMWWSQRRPE